MKEKLIVLEERYRPALGALRGISGLQAAADGKQIWLRGLAAAGSPDKLTASIPVLRWYMMDQQELLFLFGAQTPVGKLPTLNWQPLMAFIPVELPVSAMPGTVKSKMALTLSRSAQVMEPHALVTGLPGWKAYAETAPGVRLAQLQFAVSAKGQVLIMGKPLPAIAGQPYWLNRQMLLPTGFDFNPPAIAALLNPEAAEPEFLMLFDSDGQWEEVPLSAFKPARRSAVRLS
ncbi:hypothetical protein [Mucilaginibacter paludis]|uniref:MoxR-vWA-beta-propeller ternary system domain-containing protein n=1 Tax=Mucilaginibacter paludis DSM 18603 TaxID=714943 RepID=H1YH70_9SPHI|nr:hypothetical protein [Mucilaginibacter paludis]EHQ24572.1 hypothetical protein Mucpa_0376 [Mucilaginibacter paludis DSM 18603]